MIPRVPAPPRATGATPRPDLPGFVAVIAAIAVIALVTAACDLAGPATTATPTAAATAAAAGRATPCPGTATPDPNATPWNGGGSGAETPPATACPTPTGGPGATTAAGSPQPSGPGSPDPSDAGSPSPEPSDPGGPSPDPTFVFHIVRAGENLTSIAVRYQTHPRSVAYWNRDTYPSLDPESPNYRPDYLEVGWRLRVLPGVVLDPVPTRRPTVAPSVSIPPPPTVAPGEPAIVISNGARGTNHVALTFDMGGELGPALDIVQFLIDNDVRATIFPTGEVGSAQEVGIEVMELVASKPDLFAVGNHSWDHPNFTELTPEAIADQLDRAEQMIVNATGRSSKPLFRPPFGAQNAAVRQAVADAGWAYVVMWDVDTIDWRPTSDGGPTADDIVAKVLSRAEGGSIVLMHLGGHHTLEALPRILDGLHAKGLEPVTLTEMLGL